MRSLATKCLVESGRSGPWSDQQTSSSGIKFCKFLKTKSQTSFVRSPHELAGPAIRPPPRNADVEKVRHRGRKGPDGRCEKCRTRADGRPCRLEATLRGSPKALETVCDLSSRLTDRPEYNGEVEKVRNGLYQKTVSDQYRGRWRDADLRSRPMNLPVFKTLSQDMMVVSRQISPD